VRITYEQARSDFEFLHGLRALEDQVDLDVERQALMENPTKAFAMELYRAAVGLWFAENIDMEGRSVFADRGVFEIDDWNKKRFDEIKERHGLA